MKFESLRSSLVGSALAALAAFLLASCGGGGASSPGPQGGPSQILPTGGTLYAGVEYNFTVTGGRPPYFLSSSEPELLAVPQQISGNFFSVIPNNPGVIDDNVEPGSLPVRTVVLSARDSIGNLATTQGLQVAQNFFTGYGLILSSNCTATGTGGEAPSACAGGETVVRLAATINGSRFGNRTYRIEVLRGPFYWVFPNGQIAGNVMTVTTNHEGQADAIFRVNANVPTQIAVFRVTDVATGTSTEQVFTIAGTAVAAELEIIPSEITLTGPDSARCGTGSGDFLVFDGTPPYTAVSAFSGVTVTPAASNTQPGRFTFNVSNPFTCFSPATIIVTDANNNRGTVEITTEPGDEDPPPPPLGVTPATITLGCGISSSVVVIGGEGTLSASSVSPNLTAVLAGRTLTVTRLGSDPATPPNVSSQVIVTDGATTATLTVLSPTGCS